MTDNGFLNRATGVSSTCSICGEGNHSTEQCFLTPLNLKNRLSPSEECTVHLQQGRKRQNGERKRHYNVEKFTARTASAKRRPATVIKPDRLMLDYFCTLYMTPHNDKVSSKTGFDVSNRLAGDCSVSSKVKGVRAVMFHKGEDTQELNLSETPVTLDMGMSLLSVPVLVRKQQIVPFVP